MLEYIKGKLVEVEKESIILECNGMGFELFVPISILEKMPQKGENIQIYTYLEHKEDAMNLYGFLSKNEIEAFKKLLSVSGVGPKIALSALSVYRPEDIYEAILNEDISSLCKIPGIGKKSAKRIVLEIKDKINKIVSDSKDIGIPNTGLPIEEIDRNAVKALQSLGYNYKEAIAAIKSVDKEVKNQKDLNEIIKLALKNLDNL